MTLAPKRSLQRAAGPILITAMLVLALLSLLVPASTAAIHKAEPKYPTVNDERREFNATNLGSSPPRISGLRDITITTDYNADQGTTELIDCPGELRYTFDGTSPLAATAKTADMACGEAAQVPQKGHSYSVELPPSAWNGAPDNALVQFMIRIDVVGGPTPFDDTNAGAFYKFRLDRSQASLSVKVPGVPPGSSTQDAATTNDKPPISFTLVDNPNESPIMQSSIGIDVNGQNRTDQFDCTFTNPHTLQCNFNYQKAPTGFNFTVNQLHTIVVSGRDTSLNEFSTTGSTMKFRVDRVKPTIKDITAQPQTFTPGGADGLPITARNVNVTVRATVEDPSMNTNSQSAVFAFLYNQTRNLVTPGMKMEFNKTSGKWQTFNLTIPSTWPAEEFRVHARILAFDMASNFAIANTTNAVLILDPVPPAIVDVPVGTHTKDTAVKVRASVKDSGSGVDPNTVILHYSNATGRFKAAPPSSHTKIDNNDFEVKMTREGTTDNYSADIPAAENGAIITYFVKAKDKAGGSMQTPLRTYGVDLNGPNITEPLYSAYRGKGPYVFTFDIRDQGIGVNHSTAKIFFTTGSTYASQTLNRSGNTYTASLSLTIPDGTQLKYYVEALDMLGNKASLGNTTQPRNTTIDLTPPQFTMTAPANASAPTFLVSWNATDNRSGVDTYTIQARVLAVDGTPSAWITIRNKTTTKSLDFCGEGGRTYQFRGFATDKVGNAGTPPTTQQAQTVLSGAGCAEGVVVSIISPRAGDTVSGAGGSYDLRYSAGSTRSFTPAESLVVKVEFSPDGTFWHTLAPRVPNTGTYRVNLTDVPNCGACLFRVTAESLSGAKGEGTSGSFRILTGSNSVDLDGNGLADSWELTYGSKLGALKADDDSDGDGLTNLEEAAVGSDPNAVDTDGDGVNDRIEVNAGTDPRSPSSVPTPVQARTQQYTQWYWSVPAMFGACSILFFAGLARRW